jgi:hypothetical protein
MIQSILIILLIYAIFIVSFSLYICNPKWNNIKSYYETLGIIKDKDYIIFFNSLSNFYYITLIILFTFIFKNNGLVYLLSFNLYFILFLFFILIIYSILFSNFFNIKLFKLYLIIKNNINLFLETDFLDRKAPYTPWNLKKHNKIFCGLVFTKRHYATSQEINDELDLNKIEDSDLEFYPDSAESDTKEFSLIKEQAINKFKKTYGKGYLGYTLIQDFGNVPDFSRLDSNNLIEKLIGEYTKSLEPKIKKYLN